MKNLKNIETAIRERKIDLISADVFDTLVLRTTRPEQLRFWQMAGVVRSLLPEGVASTVSQEDIFSARILATRAAYRCSRRIGGCDETTIEEIHRLQLSALGLQQALAEVFLESEIACEIEDLAPNRCITRLLKHAQSEGIRIVYTSDMYLSAAIIDRLLRVVGADLPFDGRYSSADIGLSKRDGPMFDYISDQQAIPPAKCLHIGDSRLGDYDQPQARGWQAIHWPRSPRWRLVQRARLVVFKASLYTRHLAH